MAPRSLWARATLALVAVAVALLPVGPMAAAQQRDAEAADAAAHRAERVLDDVWALEAGVLEESAGLRGAAVTGVPPDPYAAGRALAVAARASLAAGGSVSGLEEALPPFEAAADAWQGWADARLAALASAGLLAPGTAGLGGGEDLLGRFEAAAARLDELASALVSSLRTDGDRLAGRARAAEVAAPIVGSVPLLVLGSLILWLALRPVRRLARTANRLAGGLDPDVPYAGRGHEMGKIARALVGWRRAAASQRLIWRHSPVAMLVFGADLTLRQVNPAQLAMFRSDPGRFNDRDYMASIVSRATHPDDARATARMYRRLMAGDSDTERLEKRYIRSDDTVFWGDLILTVVRDEEGRPDHYVAMIKDVTERREELEQAASVQRDLLPEAAPDLEGYDLSGLCRPSRETCGDFYDWQLQEPGGLVVTLGDVMGKDMPAALLMVTVALALRTGAGHATPAEAVRSVAAVMAPDLARAGAFVTLFHGRLDPASGVLTYVDAGHGLAVVVGAAAARLLPRATSLPLGVLEGQEYEEQTVRLEIGEALVLFSDGVLDVHPELETRLEAVAELLAGARSAGEMAERLVTGPGAAADDVTVVVLVRKGRDGSDVAAGPT
jgi:PAS domain S-box-containing protein